MIDLAAARLSAQRLVGEPLPSAVDAVRWLTAVQAQDYPAAKWALAQRVGAGSEAELDRAYDAGAFLRMHVLRPTWHFVLPDDAVWLTELTGARVRAGSASRWRELEIDDAVLARAMSAMEEACAERHLTRPQLAEVLAAAGIVTDAARLTHLVHGAELAGLLTSGARQGKQHTYALMSERAPRARRLDREAAVAELALRYFRSHGPAQLVDFAWWSGLTVADGRRGVAAAGSALERVALDGKEYWFDPTVVGAAVDPPAHLLPNYDEYTVAYRDRSAALDPKRPFDPSLTPFGSVLANVATIAGRICGTWRRTAKRGAVRVDVRSYGALNGRDKTMIAAAGERLGRHLGASVDVGFG